MDAHGQKAKKREKIVTIIQMQALSQVLPSCIFGPCKSVSHILVDKPLKPKYFDLLGACPVAIYYIFRF